MPWELEFSLSLPSSLLPLTFPLPFVLSLFLSPSPPPSLPSLCIPLSPPSLVLNLSLFSLFPLLGDPTEIPRVYIHHQFSFQESQIIPSFRV